MRVNLFIFGVVILSIACNVKGFDEVELHKKEINKKSCKVVTLNVQSVSDVEISFVWKKYGVVLDWHIGDMTRVDTTYIEAMKQIVIENKGADVIDSILIETNEMMKKNPIDRLQYYDGAYSFLLDARPINGTSAKVINEEEYYKAVDSVSNSVKEEMSDDFLLFWVTVDTTGNLLEIELMNDNCKKGIRDVIAKSYKKVKWKPALYNNVPVVYRFKESIFVGNLNK